MVKAKENLYDVIIVGGGPAGLTSALYLARACYRVLVLEKEIWGGQITLTSEVVNYPGITMTDGNSLTSNMHKQAEKFGAEFKLAEVQSVDLTPQIKTVKTTAGEFSAFGIILATGASPRKTGFKGEAEFAGHGVAYCATCDGGFFRGKDVFVIGGGYAAAEESVYLTKFAKSVTILIRDDDFSCAKSVADKARNNPKITVKTNTVVEEVSGDMVLKKLVYKNTKTGEKTVYEPDASDTFGVFSFAGYIPATSLFKDSIALNEQGYVITDKNQKTNIEGVYAAGDVCEKDLRQIVTAVGDGGIAATQMEKYCNVMREKTGTVPQILKQEENEDELSESETNGKQSSYFSEDTVAQLTPLFAGMANSLILSISMDDSDISRQALAFMTELCELTDKLSLEIDNSSVPANELPRVRVLNSDKTTTGLAFHGVPSGHEFTSFVLGLYNSAGPGQKISEDLSKRISQINNKLDIVIIVSLSCTMCPELVTSAQMIAARNENVTAEVYDIAHFPDLQKKYNIMSVPCMIINDGKPIFGKKNLEQLLDVIKN